MTGKEMREIEELKELWGADAGRLLEAVRRADVAKVPYGFSTRLQLEQLQVGKRREWWRRGVVAVPLFLILLSVAILFRGETPEREPLEVVMATVIEEWSDAEMDILDEDLRLLEEL